MGLMNQEKVLKIALVKLLKLLKKAKKRTFVRLYCNYVLQFINHEI